MSFSLTGEKTKNYPLKSDKEYILVYFGFPGCSTACPTTLYELAQCFKEMKTDEIELHFINITRGIPSETTELYAKGFHPNFKGFTLNTKLEKQILNEFNIIPIKDFDPVAEHSTFTFLLKSDKSSQPRLIGAFPDTKSASYFLKNNF